MSKDYVSSKSVDKEENMKKLIATCLATIMALSLVGCSGSSAPQTTAAAQETTVAAATTTTAAQETTAAASGADVITFTVGHVDAEDAPSNRGLLLFKDYVESHTDKMKVEVYPNGVLGGERENVEAVELGTLNMCFPTASVMAMYDNKFNLLEFPFLFKDLDAVYAAYDGELGQIYNDWCAEHDLLILGYTCGGFRGISSNFEIHKPEDMKGMKIRCIESETFMTLFSLLGANPTPMSWNEVYTGLEQGTIEGQDNPPQLTYTGKFYEKQKCYTFTNHVALCVPMIVKKSYFESLDPELQQVLKEAAKAGCDFIREDNIKEEKVATDAFTEAGMTLITLTDEEHKMFQDAIMPMYDDYAKVVGQDILDLALSYSK